MRDQSGGARQREHHMPKILSNGEHSESKQAERLSMSKVEKVKSCKLTDWTGQQVKEAEKL